MSFLCPSCPCTNLNPTQLIHLSLYLGLGSPLVPLWTSLTLGLTLSFVTGPALLLLGCCGTEPLVVKCCTSSPSCHPFPGLPLEAQEQLGLSAPWQLKIKILTGMHKLAHHFEWFLRKLSPVFTSSGSCAVSHEKPKFYFWWSSQRWTWGAPCLIQCFFVLSFSVVFLGMYL